MLWLGGFHALDLTTSTPDAFCPPLEEARAAVKARVGEVRGDFHAEFGLVRRGDGRQALELVLREGAEQVLRRELPLDEAGCEDAAQAIALVLERYLDALESPEPDAAPKLESVSVTPDRSVSQVVAAPPTTSSRDQVWSEPTNPSKNLWRARGGLVYDWELGIAPTLGVMLYPRGLELSSRVRIGAALDVAAFLPRSAQTIREQDLTLSTLQTALSIPLTLTLGPWGLSLGPWAHFRFQRAEAPPNLHGEAQYRALAGLGGFAQMTFDAGSRWSFGAGASAGKQVTGSATRFVLEKDNGERSAVLVPDSWFLQAHLVAALRF